MAYNLESLVNVIERLLRPAQRKLLHYTTIPQIESLLEAACFLRDSLANYATSSKEKIATLEDQIRHAAQKAEDVLETYIAHPFFQSSDHVSSLPVTTAGRTPPPNLRKFLKNLNSAKEEMMKIDLDGGQRISSSSATAAVSVPRTDPSPDKIVVGRAYDLMQLKDRVLGESSKLEIIPIVGMGGIGKTTLARKIYDGSSVVSHFDARAWTTVSDDYSVRDILLSLLSCITGKRTDEMIQEKDNQLIVTLHQNLMGKRYLIVLDDVWRSKAWDDVKKFLPNENMGSRIILTTRESDVATYADSKSPHHKVGLLGRVDSWKLLTEEVFGDETCPLEYEELGIKIADSCGGLPLAIHVIGGLLSSVNRKKESWEQVADDVSTALANKDEHFSRILSLSYDHLPYYLKPCFLYMAAFPEDHHIQASKLERLWVAEGFLKPTEDKSPEEAAEIYLEALVARNLIFAIKRKTNGKLKYCVMHDLLRDLCVAKAREKKFFHVMMGQTQNVPQDTLCVRRVSVHAKHCNQHIYNSTGQMSLARSLMFTGRASIYILSPILNALQLLRVCDVLDVMEIGQTQLSQEIQHLVNLRYFAFTCRQRLPTTITMLRNLETLIVQFTSSSSILVSHEIFNMPYLREIKFICSRSVRCGVEEPRNLILQDNLQSLSTLEISYFDIVLGKVPNLIKLGIHYSKKSDTMATDLSCLRKLERLKCSTDLSPNTETFLSNMSFPVTLKKLCLSSCKVTQACMKTIGMLPNLEILKLETVVFESETWEPCEGEFCRLHFLLLQDLVLYNWLADETQFPRLQHLRIRGCRSLNEIPSGIGEISTLKTIEVFYSTPSVVASARKIQEEQLEYGNDLLQVDVLA